MVSIQLCPLTLAASEEGQTGDAFSYNTKALVFADAQYPAVSTQNPDNAFLHLYRYSGELHVRPDFFLDLPSVSAVFKPRFISFYRRWEDGADNGQTDSRNRAFVNEWRAQAKPFSPLYLSFGKEKLLWGPSFLAAPSNLLFTDSEKANPYTEVEGKYLAKMIYVPDKSATFNLITETQRNVNELHEKAAPLTVLKMDYVGGNFQLSVIDYLRPRDRFRAGSFGQWTASDALLLYYDGLVTKGTDALYPALDPNNPLGGAFVKQYDASSRIFTTVTAGGSYTFLTGGTLSMEFLYNGRGYNDAEAASYYRLRQNASDHFFDNGPLFGPAHTTLGQTMNNGLSFLRRYYLMGQLHIPEIRNVLDLVLRYTYCLEDRAGQAASIIEWQLTNRIQLFNLITVAVTRGRESEFNSLFSKSFLAGLEMHY
jgi:hypothetical protein